MTNYYRQQPKNTKRLEKNTAQRQISTSQVLHDGHYFRDDEEEEYYTEIAARSARTRVVYHQAPPTRQIQYEEEYDDGYDYPPQYYQPPACDEVYEYPVQQPYYEERYTDPLPRRRKVDRLERWREAEARLLVHTPHFHPAVLILCGILAVLLFIFLLANTVIQKSNAVNHAPGGATFQVQVYVGSPQDQKLWIQGTPPGEPTKVVQKTIQVHASGTYSVLGKPTISVAFINKQLAAYHSPAAGKGQALYDLGVQWGINPAYALDFFMHESTFGTRGEARTTMSLGNLRCIPDHQCVDQNRGGYAQMTSWEDGFNTWYKLIRVYYVGQRGFDTVDKIIPTYAPNSDNNNEQGYIQALKSVIDTWQSGGMYDNQGQIVSA